MNCDITFRPIYGHRGRAASGVSTGDLAFLYRVYASTRAEEMAMTGWDSARIEEFLRLQFDIQHRQYRQNYPDAAFEIILYKKKPAGRLYVDRRREEIRIIDLALLPDYRRRGIGTAILESLMAEADTKQLRLGFHVEANNPALRLYERLGFQKSGGTGVYFFMERPKRPPATMGTSN